MKKSLISFLLLCLAFQASAQKEPPEIAYLKTPPVIDGKPEYELQLKRQRFQVMEKSHAENGDTKAEYEIAYGPDFLYLSITYQAEKQITRDRAYVNGDGFIFTIGTSEPDSAPTSDYFTFGFSNSREWDRKVLWFASGEQVLKGLGEEVKMECGQLGDHITFEVLVPWKTIYPFNPFFTQKKLGINISLVQAIGPGNIQKNMVSLVKDDLFLAENTPRKYLVPVFAPLQPVDHPQFYLSMQQNTLTAKDPVVMALSSLFSEPSFFQLRTTIYSGENEVSFLQTDTFSTGGSRSVFFFSPRTTYSPGGYRLVIEVLRDSYVVFTDDRYFTVLPDLNPEEMKARLNRLKTRLVKGTYNTLMFYNQDYADKLKKVKPYQTSYETRVSANRLSYVMEKLMDGNDLIATQLGIVRRAYYATTDSTFQPYSIFLPRYYEVGKRYPVIFYLHTNNEDDRGMAQFLATVTRDFMVVAPYGRGENHCFATPEAIQDFKAVLDDVKKTYFMDTTQMYLAGFSMGGYGVYRIQAELPNVFKGLIILSGNPNLANLRLGSGYPDYSDPSKIKGLKGKEVFIYHGVYDQETPMSVIQKTVNNLKKAGAKVTFLFEERGLGPMGEANRQSFRAWMKDLTGI